MEQYEPARVGRLFAWGGEHVVYKYGTDEVIKFSNFDCLLWGTRALLKAERDLSLSTTAFGSYLVPTRLAVSPDGRRIAKIQEFVSGRPMRRADLHDASIRHQFVDIMGRRARLIETSSTDMDLVGGRGILIASFGNIFFTGDTLRIVDTLLLSDMEPSPFRTVISFVHRHLRNYQNRLAQDFLRAF